MTICKACGVELRQGARFCDMCGTKVEKICPSCGEVLRDIAKFCDLCGEKLPAERIVTVKRTVQGGVSAGKDYTVGLKSDGTVVAVGDNRFGQCDVSGWTDVVAIDAGVFHTVAMRADGTLLAVGSNANNQCNVS